MKCWAKFAALLLSVAAIQASSQSAPEGQGGAQETQTGEIIGSIHPLG